MEGIWRTRKKRPLKSQWILTIRNIKVSHNLCVKYQQMAWHASEASRLYYREKFDERVSSDEYQISRSNYKNLFVCCASAQHRRNLFTRDVKNEFYLFFSAWQIQHCYEKIQSSMARQRGKNSFQLKIFSISQRRLDL